MKKREFSNFLILKKKTKNKFNHSNGAKMSKILKSLRDHTTYADLKSMPMKLLAFTLEKQTALYISSSNNVSTFDFIPLLNTTASYLKKQNTSSSRKAVEMNFGTKLGYIIAFVFIFFVGCLGLVGRLAYRGNETSTYLVYMKYHRENEVNNYTTNEASNRP